MSKILNPLKRIDRLKARFRLWLDLCPRCNSDAPAIDTCWVCWNGNLAERSLRIGEVDTKTIIRNLETNILKSRWEVYKVTKENERDFMLKYKAKGKKPIKYNWPTK